MPDSQPDALGAAHGRQAALSRWDNEGGAGTGRPPAATPYKRTAVFNEDTLPAGLRREHRTKPGVWGVIRVLDGRVRYRVLDPVSELILEPDHPGLVRPDQPHFVEPLGPVRIQIEFYRQLPDL